MSECIDDYARVGNRYGRHLRIVLEDAVPVSWNKLLRQNHWRVTEASDAIRLEVVAALHELAGYPEPFSRPVHIIIVSYKRARPIDADNIMAKLYIDALRGAGLLVDDDPAHLAGVTTISRVDRDYPRIEIDIQEVA